MSPVGQVSVATGGAAGGAEPRNTTCVPLAAAGAAALMVAPRIVTGAGTASPTAAPVTAVARPSSASAARTSLPPLLAMVPVALILRPDPDIRARRVLDRGELAVAGLAGRYLAAGVFRDPAFPDRPPRIRTLGRAGEPFLGGRRVGVVLPMAVFAARRIDDAGDVARGRQHEFDRPGIELRRSISRAPRRDMVVAG